VKPTWTIRRHVLAWVILSCLALVYLAGLLLLPFGGMEPGQSDEANIAARLGARGTGKLDSADFDQMGKVPREAVAIMESLRKEIIDLRRQVDTLQGSEKTLRQRLAVLEDALGPTTASLPPQSAETGITGSLRDKPVSTKESPKLSNVTVAYEAMPADGFADVLFNDSPLPVAGVLTSTQTLFGIELGVAGSKKALHKQWTDLGSNHKALLGGLEARYRELDTKDDKAKGDKAEEQMALVAGPFHNAAGAALLCARLRANSVKCKETVFAGENF
jgi:hypothetical protein